MNISNQLVHKIINCTGTFSAKQYVKGKPNPWGIKIFMLCGRSGFVYDFLLYQGTSTEFCKKNYKQFGLSTAVVLKLTEHITKEGHFLYFDNYFLTYQLFKVLQQKKIFAAGTVRINRFGKTNLISDKEANKKQRGYSQEISSTAGIALVKWMDNKPVILASNFIGIGQTDVVERWSKKEKKMVNVTRPEIVCRYNSSMGGVDLFDQLISYYRIFVKSRKWPHCMICYGFDFAVVQAWLEYRKRCSFNWHC